MPVAKSSIHLPLLESATIASPCDRMWEDMQGDSRVRHCSACNLNVYNFAEMTSIDAEAFLRERLPKGRVCGVLFRRADGTILTKDCPVGVSRLRRAAAWSLARIAVAITFVLGGISFATDRDTEARLRSFQPFRSVCEWLNPAAKAPPTLTPFVAGKIACPPPPRSLPPGGAQ